MHTADRLAVTNLASHHEWPSMTLYLPTHRVGSEKEQDRIRLKNLLRDGCARLVEHGMRDADADALCTPVRATLEDESYWRDVGEGLAIFVSDSGATIMRLTEAVPEQVVVGDRFYLRPLLATHHGDERFFALALNRAGCRLFRGDHATIEHISLEGVPTSLADELRYDETQPAVQYSSVPSAASAAGPGRPGGAVFHGHGGEKDTDKINLERYLRKVEAAVTKIASAEPGVPLLLMGVEYEIAMYRSLNQCPCVAEQQVTGANDYLTEREVHERALSALAPRFAAAIDAELNELSEREGSALSSHDPADIVAAAVAGRVKTLFFDDATGPYGTLDRETGRVARVCGAAPRLLRESGEAPDAPTDGECGWDLVDLAAAETALHGGEIHAFTGEDAPVHGVAAVYRY